MDAHSGFQRAPMRVQALEGGQQRGVDVDHPALPFLDERRGEQAHIAGQRHQFGAETGKGGVDRGVMRFLASMVGAGNDLRRNATRDGKANAGGVRPVGDDADDLGREVGIGGSGDQRGHVGAAAGNEDRGALALWSHRPIVPR